MMRYLQFLYFLLFIFCLLFFPSCKKSTQSDVLRITVNSWVGFGPLYVAKEHGIFEKHQLNVEIIKLENAPDRRAALLSSRVDILGSTLDDLAVTLSQGIQAVAFACADFSNGADGIIAANGINTLEELIKVPIAVQPGFVNHFFLLYVLDKNGIPTENIKINPMTPDDAGAAFLAGNIDAAVTWEPFLSQALKKRQGTILLAKSSDYPEAILDMFVSTREWHKKNPETVRRFKASWDDAIKFLKENKEAGYLTIGKETGIDPTEVGAMLDGAYLLTSQESSQLLSGKLKSLSEIVERLWRNAGYVEKSIDLESSVILQ